MHGKLITVAFLTVLGTVGYLGFASGAESRYRQQASELFGNPLRSDDDVFPLSESYVIWLAQDIRGELLSVTVGPKSHYVTEFPNVSRPSQPEVLSDSEYNGAIAKISQLKDVGRLLKRHGGALPCRWGPMNTDRYQSAFVDRLVLPGNDDAVISFEVYFVREVSGSLEQILDTEDGPMICLGNNWYYALSDSLQLMKLGDWQNRLVVAGPNLHNEPCVRPKIWHNAEGFTFEGLVNHTVRITEPYSVRGLVGRVFYHDSPVPGAYVEFKRAGSAEILLTKTDELGFFKLRHAPEGEYELLVTRNEFWALSGTVLVSHRAKMKKLAFNLHEGT